MKKRTAIISLLAAAVLTLNAIPALATDGQGQVSPLDQLTQQQSQMESMGLPSGYNPASEEDNGYTAASGAYNANGERVYAGATPIPIDPIDMPTPTPRPELTFTYGEYTAAKLGFTFKSAVGYMVDDSASDTYILTEPASAVRDGYPCVITLQVTPITSNYAAKDVQTDLANYLKNLGAQYPTKWETWKAASKKLAGGTGYYNNYRGVMSDGTIVRGRVHMAIIGNNKLLTLHITCPGWYNSSYMKIYDNIYSSIKAIQ